MSAVPPSEPSRDDDLPTTPEDFVVPDDLSGLLEGEAQGTEQGAAPDEVQGGGQGHVPDDAASGTADASPSRGEAPAPAAEPAEPAVPPGVNVAVTQLGSADAVAAACALAGLDVDAVLSGIGVLVVPRDPAPEAARAVARTLSRAVAGIPLLLLEREGDRIVAHRWQDGDEGDQLAPGLVLDGAPEALSNLLLGVEAVADLPGVVTSAGMGRLKAMRVLAASGRAARKAAKGAGRGKDARRDGDDA